MSDNDKLLAALKAKEEEVSEREKPSSPSAAAGLGEMRSEVLERSGLQQDNIPTPELRTRPNDLVFAPAGYRQSAGADFMSSLFNSAINETVDGLANLIPTIATAVSPQDSWIDNVASSWITGVDKWTDSWKMRVSHDGAAGWSLTDQELNSWSGFAGNAGSALGSALGFLFSGGSVKVAGRAGKFLPAASRVSRLSKVQQALPAVVGGYTYMTNQLYEEYKGAGLSNTEAARLSSLAAVPIAMSEYLGLRMVGKALRRPVVSAELRGAVRESVAGIKASGGRLTAENMRDIVNSTSKSAMSRIFGIAKSGGRGAFVEGAEEVVQGRIQDLSEQIFDQVTGSEYFESTPFFSEENLKRDLDNMFWGALVGGVLGSGAGVARTVQGNDLLQESLYKHIGNLVDSGSESGIQVVKDMYQGLLDSGSITDTEFTQASELIDRMVLAHKSLPPDYATGQQRYEAYQLSNRARQIDMELAELQEAEINSGISGSRTNEIAALQAEKQVIEQSISALNSGEESVIQTHNTLVNIEKQKIFDQAESSEAAQVEDRELSEAENIAEEQESEESEDDVLIDSSVDIDGDTQPVRVTRSQIDEDLIDDPELDALFNSKSNESEEAEVRVEAGEQGEGSESQAEEVLPEEAEEVTLLDQDLAGDDLLGGDLDNQNSDQDERILQGEEGQGLDLQRQDLPENQDGDGESDPQQGRDVAQAQRQQDESAEQIGERSGAENVASAPEAAVDELADEVGPIGESEFRDAVKQIVAEIGSLLQMDVKTPADAARALTRANKLVDDFGQVASKAEQRGLNAREIALLEDSGAAIKSAYDAIKKHDEAQRVPGKQQTTGNREIGNRVASDIEAIPENEGTVSNMLARLKAIYPYINIKTSEDLGSDEQGRKVFGKAYVESLQRIVEWVAKGGPADLIPHEYAHHYVDMLRNHPLVAKAIEKYGEESLVQKMGEKFVARSKMNKLEQDVRKIWVALKTIFGSRDILDLISEGFYEGLGPDGSPFLENTENAAYNVEGSTLLGYRTSTGADDSSMITIDNVTATADEMIDRAGATKIEIAPSVTSFVNRRLLPAFLKGGQPGKANVDAVISKIHDVYEGLVSPKTLPFLKVSEGKLVAWWKAVDQSRSNESGVGGMEQLMARYAAQKAGEEVEDELSDAERLAYWGLSNLIRTSEAHESRKGVYLTEQQDVVHDMRSLASQSIPGIQQYQSWAAPHRGKKSVQGALVRFADLVVKYTGNIYTLAAANGIRKGTYAYSVIVDALQNSNERFNLLSGEATSILRAGITKGFLKNTEYENPNGWSSLEKTETETSNGSISMSGDERLQLYLTLRQDKVAERRVVPQSQVDEEADLESLIETLEAANSPSVLPELTEAKSKLAKLRSQQGSFVVAKKEGRPEQRFRMTEQGWEALRSEIEADADMVSVIGSMDQAFAYLRSPFAAVFSVMTGQRLASVENYFPLINHKSGIETDERWSDVEPGLVEDYGRAKDRVYGNQDLSIDSAMRAASSTLRSTAHYTAFARQQRNAEEFVNEIARQLDKKDDPNMIALSDQIRAMRSSSTMAGADNFNRRALQVTRKFYVGVLGWNIPVMGKQLASAFHAWNVLGDPKYVAYAAEPFFMGPKLWFRALAGKSIDGFDNEAFQEMLANNPVAKIRMESMIYDEVGTGRTDRYPLDPNAADKKFGTIGRMAAEGGNYFLGKATDGIQAFDAAAIFSLWKAAKKYAEDRGFGGDMEAIVKVHNNLISRSQPTYDQLNRSRIQRTQNALVRGLALFSTQRLKHVNLIAETAIEVAQDLPGARKRLANQLITIGLVNSAIISAIDMGASAIRGQDDDDEDNVTEFANRMVGNFFGNMPVLGDIASTAYNGLTGSEHIYVGESSVPVLDLINAAKGSAELLSEREFDRWVDRYLLDLMQYTGIPTRGLEDLSLILDGE